MKLSVKWRNEVMHLEGHGNGLLSAVIHALNIKWVSTVSIVEYFEHTLGQQSTSRSISYIACVDQISTASVWGVAMNTDIATSSIQALLNAFSNRVLSFT